MKEYFKRLEQHPGLGVVVVLTVIGFAMAFIIDPTNHWHAGILFGVMVLFPWTFLLISNIKKSAPTKYTEMLPELREEEILLELKRTEWTPVIGYEKYYEQNSEGKVRSLGNEFEFNIEHGNSEEKAAFLTMCYLKGYFSRDIKQTNNINKILEVMKKNWIDNDSPGSKKNS